MNLADVAGTKQTCVLRLKSDSFTFNNWLRWMRSFIHQRVFECSHWLYCWGIRGGGGPSVRPSSRALLPPWAMQLPQTLERPHADVQGRMHLPQVRFSDQRQAADAKVRVKRVWGADGDDRRKKRDKRSVTLINTCCWHTLSLHNTDYSV